MYMYVFSMFWLNKLSVFSRKQKEIMKDLETPEEKLARRIKKKQEKERRRREKRGWDKKDLVCVYIHEEDEIRDIPTVHVHVHCMFA